MQPEGRTQERSEQSVDRGKAALLREYGLPADGRQPCLSVRFPAVRPAPTGVPGGAGVEWFAGFVGDLSAAGGAGGEVQGGGAGVRAR
jgi:hypothetical protein